MSPNNDLLISKLTIRLRNTNNLQTIGSGTMVAVKDKIYLLTAAHCLFSDKDGYNNPNESVIIDFYNPETNNYLELIHVVDYNLVNSNENEDVAILLLDRAMVEAMVGEIPNVSVISERQSSTNFVVKGFPNATQGKELDVIRPTWKQNMTGVSKFQLQLNENYNAWATAGFSGSGIYVQTQDEVYLFGIFTRFRAEDLGKVIYAQYLKSVNTLLVANWLRPLSFTFFGQYGLNPFFFNNQIEGAVKNLGPRFNERLNLRLPVAKLFNTIVKDDRFKRRLLGIFDTYLTTKTNSSYNKSNHLTQAVDLAFDRTRENIIQWLNNLNWLPDAIIDFGQIISQIDLLSDLISKKRGELFELQSQQQAAEIRKEREYNYRPPYADELHHLYTLSSANDHFVNSIEDANIALANNPILFIKGDAGCGKSHMLGDIAIGRARQTRPTLLLLGQLFKREKSVWTNVLEQLQLTCTKEELLSTLNSIGRQIGSRFLILIDALNEGDGKALWPNELSGFIHEIRRYPFIAIVMTVRSTYWDILIPKTAQTDPSIIKFDHNGFKGNEYEALKMFCTFYQLPQPNFPILAPEYANPLFLQLVCEGVKDSSDNKFPQGFQGISRLFGYYLGAVSKKLATKRDEYLLRTKLVEDAIMELSRACYNNESTPITLESAVSLFDHYFPRHPALLNDLIQENVFIRSLRHNHIENTDEDVIYFSYERFGDFYFAKELIKNYQSENEIVAAFSRDGALGQVLLEKYYLISGTMEAMAVILPEQTGLEIVEVFAWVFNDPDMHNRRIASEWINHWLLDSLKWRTVESVNPKKLMEWFNSEHFTVDFDHFLNFLVELTPVKGHPFNSDFLHRYLSGLTMQKRDSFLQQFFVHYSGLNDDDNPYPIRRLIEWAWQSGISTLTDSDTARLVGQFLAWLLSATHRQLRDQVTKAMVNLLEEQPDALLSILKAFEEVDDFYIRERIYAVAYGCSLRTSEAKALQIIAQHVFDSVFNAGAPIAHILLRDYARNTVEYAVYRNLKLTGNISAIQPPYNTSLPDPMPSEEDMKSYKLEHDTEGFRENYGYQHNRIHFSVLEWDFGRYTIDSNLNQFSPASFRTEEKVKRFIKSLKPSKRNLIRLYMTVHDGLMFITQSENNGRTFKNFIDDITPRDFYTREIDIISELMDTQLDDDERKFVTNIIKPHLEKIIRSKDTFRYTMDTRPNKRWIVSRAFELGYQAELHGEFDSSVERHNNRHENSIERIGKKYQWIAFHELLAYMTDNYKLRDGYGSNAKFRLYQGPWQHYLRDVDPAFTTRKILSISDDGEDGEQDILGIVEPTPRWWSPAPYLHWNQIHADWVINKIDMPDPKDILLRLDDQNQEWLYLHLNVHWNEPKSIGVDKYDRLKKDIWYGFQGYLVKKSSKPKILQWLRKKNFFGRWMPESHSLSGLFNREHYWSPASKFYQKGESVWKTLEGSKHKVILATEEAVGELSDDKSGAHFGFHMPCRTLFEGMNLQYAQRDGDFRNVEGDILVTNCNPNGVLVRKKELLAFLEESELELVWALLGEKNVWGGQNKSQEEYFKAISGVYSLSAEGTPSGDFKILDRE